MNHNILNKIYDKLELPKEVYKTTIKRPMINLKGTITSTAYFYKRDDALDAIKYGYMHHFSKGIKREISFSNHVNTIVRIDQMEGYNLLVEHPTFRNLTDEQKENKLFDTILREKLQNGYSIILNVIWREELINKYQSRYRYKIVTKSIN